MTTPTSRLHWDAARRAPLHPIAKEAYLQSFDDGWADPDRIYREARRCRQLVDAAREVFASTLSCRTQDVIFVTGRHTAVFESVLGAVSARPTAPHIAVAATETELTLQATRHAAATRPGTQVHHVAVSPTGRLDLDDCAAAVDESVSALVVQAANLETGTTQALEQIAHLTRQHGVSLVVDMDGTLGHANIPTDWDIAYGSAAPFGGPPGAAFVARRPGARWTRPTPGPADGPGTVRPDLDVPALVAAAATLHALTADPSHRAVRHAMVADLRHQIADQLPGAVVVGEPEARLPHVMTASFLYADAALLAGELDRRGVAAGSGSACTSDTGTPSHVLVAMGQLSHGNVRFAIPAWPPPDPARDVDVAVAALVDAVGAVRQQLGVADLDMQP